ncbi:DNA-binding protein [Nocardia nova]|uniref:helix-turn-helix domain-containing protein n=1 Tax=Nocardia nova TaxID=37330 RepID=UPI000CEA4D4E|nr:helix-turn-helix domain-containing protein [Nocardia nova]PPJ01218.1 DNA-binding protein [Nocardia nova]
MSTSLIRDEKAVLSIGASEVAQARAFKDQVEQVRGTALADDGERISVGLSGGDSVEMPAQLTSLVSQILDLVSRGCTVTVGSVPNEVTTTTAAKMLGISRPTLMKMVKDKTLPAHKVGSHTRLFSRDVLDHKERQRAAQREAFDRLRELEDELGMTD